MIPTSATFKGKDKYIQLATYKREQGNWKQLK